MLAQASPARAMAPREGVPARHECRASPGRGAGQLQSIAGAAVTSMRSTTCPPTTVSMQTTSRR